MILNPQSKFKIEDIEELLHHKGSFELSRQALKTTEASARFLRTIANSKKAVYGVNTGFGRLAEKRIAPDRLVDLQINLLRSHACGIGEPLSFRVTRRLLLLRLLSLGKGYSGVSCDVLTRHVDYLNKRLHPHIPEQGSVGASGDLAPLAHLGLTFIGEWKFIQNGKLIAADRVLKAARMWKLPIGPKEGLSLVNGTQFSLALSLESRSELHHLLSWMEAALCLSVEAHRATAQTYRSDLHKLKAHRHQQEFAARIYNRLQNSPHMRGHKDCDLVQDSYSFRCAAQVIGPCYALLETADQLLEGEINSISDNPVIFARKKEVLSGGHFHAHSVSMASDLLSLSVATLGNLIERRIDQMVNPLTSRGAAFLANDPGVESGLMIVQTAAASLASENKTLAFPASADTIPTNGNQEDHVSMAPWAARKSLIMVKNLRRLVAAELLTGIRGALIEREKTKLTLSPWMEAWLTQLKRDLPFCFDRKDRIFAEDWAKMDAYIAIKFPPKSG